MAVPSWKIIDKEANELISFTLLRGDFVPTLTVYIGAATWVSVTPAAATAVVHLSEHAGVLVLRDTATGSVTGLPGPPQALIVAITYDGQSTWLLIALLTDPATYALSQLDGPTGRVVNTYTISSVSGVEFAGLCMDGWGFEEPFNGRYFYTIGDDDNVYQLFADGTTAHVVATYAITVGAGLLVETMTDIEWGGNGWFWTMNMATFRGNPTNGLLKLWKNWKVVSQYTIGSDWSGLSTDGVRLMARTD